MTSLSRPATRWIRRLPAPVARLDYGSGIPALKRGFAAVEPQAAALGRRPVTDYASLLKERSNFAFEISFRSGGRGERRRVFLSGAPL